jgi:hypothetical protein
MPSAITDSGIAHFINAILPELVSVDDGLARAIGINEIRSADIKSSQLKAIERYLDLSRQHYQAIAKVGTDATALSNEVVAASSSAKTSLQSAEADSRKIRDLRASALRLSNGTKTSPALSAILKESQEALGQIKLALSGANESAGAIGSLKEEIERHETAASKAVSGLDEQNAKARDILNNATQAGLAGAYKLEREKLARQQFWYALTFYGIIAAIILYAAVFIVPIASEVIINHRADESTSIGDSALLLFVRILIVLPAFWALIFTNKRFVYLETLQMDYAAKAVTALAYTGYRDEMGDDITLSAKLRGGLVERFIEHPSRLLVAGQEPDISYDGDSPTNGTSKSREPSDSLNQDE